VDPTQHQPHYGEYHQAHNQPYYEEPQQYHFDAYQQHQYEAYHQQDHPYQPNIEQEQSQQQEGGGQAQGEPVMEYEAGPEGYRGGLQWPHFYLFKVDTWHAGYGLMSM